MGHLILTPSHTELDLLNQKSVSDYITNNSIEAIVHGATEGGKRNRADSFDSVYVHNITMFENLIKASEIPTILLGSGAEFDRRKPICQKREEYIFFEWPLDPYGLSKNIIARRALTDSNNIRVLRLFGCFGYDEESSRFIKSCIINLKNGLPITIHQNKTMDFFYIDDLAAVIDHVLANGGPRNINLVYDKKIDLLGIANLIAECACVNNPVIEVLGDSEAKNANEYTGYHEILYCQPIASKLIGIKEGIRRMVKELL